MTKTDLREGKAWARRVRESLGQSVTTTPQTPGPPNSRDDLP